MLSGKFGTGKPSSGLVGQVDFLERKVEALTGIVANLLDALRWHTLPPHDAGRHNVEKALDNFERLFIEGDYIKRTVDQVIPLPPGERTVRPPWPGYGSTGGTDPID